MQNGLGVGTTVGVADHLQETTVMDARGHGDQDSGWAEGGAVGRAKVG